MKQKRAFTQWRSKSAVLRGDKAAAARLGKAIESAAIDHQKRRPAQFDVTHGFHPYAARMPPAIARYLLREQNGVVVDPFCGSGTTLVEARVAGMDAIGADINPLAVLLAQVKSHAGNAGFRKQLERAANAIGRQVQSQGKQKRGSSRDTQRSGRHHQEESPFSPHVYAELAAIKQLIENESGAMHAALTMCLSAIVTKVAKTRSETDRRYVHKKVARGFASTLFVDKAILLRDGLAALDKGSARALQADARNIPLSDGVADSVLTSPPYPGIYDYWRHHQVRLSFLGFDDALMKSKEIGSKRDAQRSDGFVQTWTRDFAQFLGEMARVCKASAPIYLVIGDAAIDGTPWLALDAVKKTNTALTFVAAAGQKRALRGANEKRAFANVVKREWVIQLRAT